MYWDEAAVKILRKYILSVFTIDLMDLKNDNFWQ